MTDQPEAEKPAESKPEPTAGAAAADKAKEQAKKAQQYVMSFALPQRLMLLGSGIAFLFGFLSWWSVKSPFGSHGISGFELWHGKLFFVTSLGTVLLLTVPGIRQSLIGKQPIDKQRLIFLGLTGASLLFGPVWFMFRMGSGSMPPDGTSVGISIGKTIWFWGAMLASIAAVAGGWMAMNDKSDATK